MTLKFRDDEIEKAVEYVRAYVDEREGIFTVEVKKHYANRSVPQNSYWWSICKIIALHIGTTKEAVHKLLNQENNAEIIRLPNGKVKLVGGETKSMNTYEFSQLITKARVWADQELGLYIQTPEEFKEELIEKINNEYERMFN
jgi:hypothetical protein